jgi:DNA-binding NtrC family response regulator
MRVLLVDDDEALRSGLAELLKRSGHAVTTASDGGKALPHLDDTELLVTDVRMPAIDGLGLLREARQRRPGLAVIVMTGFGSIPSAVEAMRLGARAYLTKPFEPDELLLHLREVENLLRLRAAASAGRGALVGTSALMRQVYEEIDVAAGADAPVLISGETGTGKELAARAVHQLSRRAGGPFIAINCGAIPRDLVESELFGHEAGAFTGAQARKRGRFGLARGGSLFLDEVNSLPLDVQPKLLRAIEMREIWPVGAERPEPTDLRIIAASNAALDALVASGAFRADLFYRLHVLHIDLPPLRSHPEDIPQIAHSLLTRLVADEARRPTLSAAALSQLLARPWSGNVRELANTIERALARLRAGSRFNGSAGDGAPAIGLEHLDPLPAGVPHLAFKQGRERAAEQWARAAIRAALIRSRGNTTEAARLLRMNRTAMLRLIARYGLR